VGRFGPDVSIAVKACAIRTIFFGMLSVGRTNDQNLRTILARLPEGTTEIMMHPGCDNAVLDAAYHWGYQWQADLEALVARYFRLAAKTESHLD
jgi:hypothetical protein